MLLFLRLSLPVQVMRLRSQGTHGASFLTLDDKREVVNAVADNALAAFIIIHAALRRSVRLARCGLAPLVVVALTMPPCCRNVAGS
jgi:hypothetical protein